MPASGDEQDLDEAGRALLAHERSCRFAGIAGPRGEVPARARTIDELATANAQRRVEIGMTPGAKIFHVTCQVCGDRFEASGPRTSYCRKAECQARRGRAA